MLHESLTGEILKCFYKVYNTLGYGFLEKVYENALYHELIKNGIACKKQVPLKVLYDGVLVGDYFADLIVDDLIIIELKASENIIDDHKYQLINYLKATHIEVGLLLNFGLKPQICRKIFMNVNK